MVVLNTCKNEEVLIKNEGARMLTRLFEPRHEKTNVLVSDLVRHKPGCTATEDG